MRGQAIYFRTLLASPFLRGYTQDRCRGADSIAPAISAVPRGTSTIKKHAFVRRTKACFLMVDVNGLEPLTLRTSSECSTSWAKRPTISSMGRMLLYRKSFSLSSKIFCRNRLSGILFLFPAFYRNLAGLDTERDPLRQNPVIMPKFAGR